MFSCVFLCVAMFSYVLLQVKNAKTMDKLSLSFLSFFIAWSTNRTSRSQSLMSGGCALASRNSLPVFLGVPFTKCRDYNTTTII